ncbi:hypothetical protein K2173_023178 [Erythroxylum novogranatense]|uniref:CCHC-type domain-containing protein n=1 Tax=Erythroxylum novogranatense TaxID=1862640 RepID=A0AAV8UCE5_9ROSI|nr:hypothetical protein K2173_023178 [Erythroxylum novogranatense]
MGTEDMIKLPASSNSGGGGSEDGEFCKSDLGSPKSESKPSNCEDEAETMGGMNIGLNEVGGENEQVATNVKELGLSKVDIQTEEGATDSEDLGLHEHGIGTEEDAATMKRLRHHVGEGETEESNLGQDRLVLKELDVQAEDVQEEVDMDLVDSPVVQVNIKLPDNAEENSPVFQNKSLKHTSNNVDGGSVSGVKRQRMTNDEQQPAVHIAYNSLTRASKRKLEELLQQWSEWHTHCGSSSEDMNEVMVSGEETYFPALSVGNEKSSAVSFWIENQARNPENNSFATWDSHNTPLYDRGYVLGLTSPDGLGNVERGLKIVDDASRCFNCGSYGHSLKECPKPRDNVAVNNARKQHKSRRNQNTDSRNPIRYYQNSSRGKYDGLKPGCLGAETRELLGLGELDPPPWFNRMRELGYPPGYLDPDDDNEPSGITIFGDVDVKEHEDGEITETNSPELQRKMSAEFPGINAPIPENADERLWSAAPPSIDLFSSQSHDRSNHSLEPAGRWHHHEQRWSRNYSDDGPPGVDSISPSMSSYPPRYGSYDSHSSDSLRGPTPALGRFYSERGRRSPLLYEDSTSHSPHNSFLYSKRYKLSSPARDGTDRFENENNRHDDYNLEYSTRRNDDYDRRHHHYSVRRDDEYDRYRHHHHSWR